MNILFIALGMSTLLIFLFKRDWLFKKYQFLVLLSANLLLFVLGNLLADNFKLATALKMSLISQLIFLTLVFVFKSIYKRNPVDTFWTMDMSLMKDGVFNFIFWVLGITVPAGLVFTGVI